MKRMWTAAAAFIVLVGALSYLFFGTKLMGKEAGYLYALTDKQLEKAIEKSKRNENVEQNYLLPKTTSTLVNDFVLEENMILTPYMLVLSESALRYSEQNKPLSIEEAREFFDYEHLQFITSFAGSYAAYFELELIQQGESIKPTSSQILADDRYIRSSFDVSAIDMNKPATLRVLNSKHPDQYAEYSVDFASYVPE